MTKKSKKSAKKRLLWANPNCLLDTSSGASIDVREQLHQLAQANWDVHIIGATVFDAPTGITRIATHWKKLKTAPQKTVTINDGQLSHHLVKTENIHRSLITAREESIWFDLYTKALDHFKPEVVYYYGGRTLDLLIGYEAKARGIPVVAYLANASFHGRRWCQDVDYILTNSQATAHYYAQREGIDAKPVGVFIDPNVIMAKEHQPDNLLFINPSWAKGAGIFLQLARKLDHIRPDITLEVVESRGNLADVLKKMDEGRASPKMPSNIHITSNQVDMRPIYGRARALLAPSLCWEAYGRVVAEATMNGIPSLITNRGGLPEASNYQGLTFDWPDSCYETPHTTLADPKSLQALTDTVIRLFDDEPYYQSLREKLSQIDHHAKMLAQKNNLIDFFASVAN